MWLCGQGPICKQHRVRGTGHVDIGGMRIAASVSTVSSLNKHTTFTHAHCRTPPLTDWVRGGGHGEH